MVFFIVPFLYRTSKWQVYNTSGEKYMRLVFRNDGDGSFTCRSYSICNHHDSSCVEFQKKAGFYNRQMKKVISAISGPAVTS
ncbi:hypothetical protein PBAL39_00335 [Pedobacter sp. BAL39]|nr:hypothetical protein PBAL39_00335 [Pedobacter sp. BAL39]